MKPGRNDPCLCGSGKKYKQCCLLAQEAVPPEDLHWRRVRRAIEGLAAELLKFSEHRCGATGLGEAWDTFMLWEGEPFAPESPHMSVFMPWFFFDWTPDPMDTEVKPEARDSLTLGQAYLRDKGKRLDPLLVHYIEASCAAPFSFYEIASSKPGISLTLRDILSGEQLEVTERSASRIAKTGDILFAKLAVLDRLIMLEGCSPVAIPPSYKGPILELRKKIQKRKLPFTPALIKEYDLEMLDIYHELTEPLLNPRMPELQNTDGEPLVFHQLIYDLACSPRETLDTLRQLNLTEDDKSILSGAEFDPSGELRKIEFAWEKPGNKMHKNWNNTILGRLRIEGSTLTAEVNSEKRAQKFKAIMAELLPGKARYKTTVIQSPQSMLARSEKEGLSPQARRREQEAEDLNALPEVQAHLTEMLRQHYRDWPHEKLPILKGKTPLQAVKTHDGREMVEALIVELERDIGAPNMPIDESIIAELRERLGLL